MLESDTFASNGPARPGRALGHDHILPEIAAYLRSARTVAVVTHAKPDGDALGSALALTRSLRAVKIDARMILVGPIPRWAADIRADTPMTEVPPGNSADPKTFSPWPDASPDAVAIVDTGTWTQLSELKPWLTSLAARACVIDHHLRGDSAVATRKLIRTDAASCTEVLAPVCTAILGLPTAARLPLEIAEPIYLGLATDTGWFRYSSVKPGTLRLAADALEAGVDHTRLYRIIEQQDQPGRWRLLGRALSTIQLHENGRIATMVLTVADFDSTGADRNDTSGFADMALTIASVDLAVVLTEQNTAPGKPPLTKFSLRSKPGPNAIDVNALAGKLGGGGHARAAGAKFNAPLDEAKDRLLAAFRELEAGA